MIIRRIGIFVSLLSFSAAGLFAGSYSGEADREKGEWKVLFDGSSTDAWRGFQMDDFPEGSWVVEGDTLRTVSGEDAIDIITRDEYSHFELEMEWAVGERGNSGIFFHVSEEPPQIWHWAPEYQILDDEALDLEPGHIYSAGSLYDVYEPAADKEIAPVGEFNETRLVVRGSEVEHWLNGEKILDYDLDSEEVREKIAASKFDEFEEFGTLREGHIGLQHHGTEVIFRDIRIRELKENAES